MFLIRAKSDRYLVAWLMHFQILLMLINQFVSMWTEFEETLVVTLNGSIGFSMQKQNRNHK